jgi:transcriptional regulator GlxA family with amidase domain
VLRCKKVKKGLFVPEIGEKMQPGRPSAKKVVLVAVAETAGSALYGMVDVLLAAGNIWQTLVRTEALPALFSVEILSQDGQAFLCGNGIPVHPTLSSADKTRADIVILPEIWLGPDQHLHGRYPQLMQWIRDQYQSGACIYSACSGAVLLAETGLLDGREATSHWGYQDLFRQDYPQVHFQPEPSLCFADTSGRIVTAGGTTSWHDLALHIIARHGSPGEAMRIAKVYLLKLHSEGQLPYRSLQRNLLHNDSVVADCEAWLREHSATSNVVQGLVERSTLPERTLKRRFRKATGSSIIDYVQNVRIESAKQLLENSDTAVEEICFATGYEDVSFFRRLFKRRTGLTPGQYRRMFQPVIKR